jgi:hypothetical protein
MRFRLFDETHNRWLSLMVETTAENAARINAALRDSHGTCTNLADCGARGSFTVELIQPPPDGAPVPGYASAPAELAAAEISAAELAALALPLPPADPPRRATCNCAVGDECPIVYPKGPAWSADGRRPPGRPPCSRELLDAAGFELDDTAGRPVRRHSTAPREISGHVRELLDAGDLAGARDELDGGAATLSPVELDAGDLAGGAAASSGDAAAASSPPSSSTGESSAPLADDWGPPAVSGDPPA